MDETMSVRREDRDAVFQRVWKRVMEGREETSDTADHDRNRNREQLPEFDEY